MQEFSWSYAIGTLFIRYFGIFLVLGLLMLGMIASGKIFTIIDRKDKERRGAESADCQAAPGESNTVAEQVVAVAVALYLHGRRAGGAQAAERVRSSVWAEQGRAALMAGLSGASPWRQGK